MLLPQGVEQFRLYGRRSEQSHRGALDGRQQGESFVALCLRQEELDGDTGIQDQFANTPVLSNPGIAVGANDLCGIPEVTALGVESLVYLTGASGVLFGVRLALPGGL